MASKKLILTLTCIAALAFLAVGCGSDDDSPTGPVVDTAPPALPSNLQAVYDEAQAAAVISWAPNTTDADLAGYLVSRASYDLDPVELVSAPQSANQFQDADVASCGRQVTYYISAVDESGNVSAAATVALEFQPEADQADECRTRF